MSEWKINASTLTQSELSARLLAWSGRVTNGVFTFREGPTISRFDYLAQECLLENSLNALWILRVFCDDYELFARRLAYEGEQPWQLRIVTCAGLLTDGEPVTMVKNESTVLWGESTGDRHAFIMKPNKFRRAELVYPGEWRAGDRCELVASRLAPAAGPTIVCWRRLQVAVSQESTTAE